MSRAEHAPNPSDGDLEDLVASWIRSLRARNLSPKTITTYDESAMQLVTHARVHAGVVDAAELRRKHVEEFLAVLAAVRRPATVSVRFRALQQFFGWLVDEEEITRSPMERMKRPVVPEEPVAVVGLDDARRPPSNPHPSPRSGLEPPSEQRPRPRPAAQPRRSPPRRWRCSRRQPTRPPSIPPTTTPPATTRRPFRWRRSAGSRRRPTLHPPTMTRLR